MRNRIIYANEGVFTGPAFKDGVTYSSDIQTPNLTRLQSMDYEFTVEREKSSTLGSKSILSYKTNKRPSVSLNLNYYSSSMLNENLLGFNVSDKDETFLGNILNTGDADNYQKNFYLITAEEGTDFNGNLDYSLLENVTYYSDCYFQGYTYELGIGGLPASTVNYVGENAGFIQIPSSSWVDIPILNKKNRNVLSNKAVPVPLGRDESYAYTSDFSADSDGWAATRGNASSPHTIGGKTSTLKFVADTSDDSHKLKRESLPSVSAGKKYKITGKIYIPSTCPNVKGFSLWAGNDSVLLLDKVLPTLDSWHSFSAEYIAPSVQSDTIKFWMTTNDHASWAGTYEFAGDAGGGDFFSIIDIVVTEVREMLLPSQATVQITTDSSLASGILDLENEKVSSFGITLNLEREEVDLLGHKVPQDRRNWLYDNSNKLNSVL